MGLFSKLFGKTPSTLEAMYTKQKYDINSFAKASGVSVSTLKKYADSKLEDIPTRTKNKIEKVLNG